MYGFDFFFDFLLPITSLIKQRCIAKGDHKDRPYDIVACRTPFLYLNICVSMVMYLWFIVHCIIMNICVETVMCLWAFVHYNYEYLCADGHKGTSLRGLCTWFVVVVIIRMCGYVIIENGSFPRSYFNCLS